MRGTMKNYLVTLNFPYLMTHYLEAIFGNAELVSALLNVYKITTDATPEEIKAAYEYISDVREEGVGELVNTIEE